jgi:hypothetical protein
MDPRRLGEGESGAINWQEEAFLGQLRERWFWGRAGLAWVDISN